MAISRIKIKKINSIFFIIFFVFFLKFPFFFTDVFNWDESTYIIIGQWIIDGGLPYIERTEVKPPLLGYLYAISVFLSFDELYFIRFLNYLLIIINIFFILKIFKLIFNKRETFFLISSYIFSSIYIIRDSNALLSEHFAVTFLIISLYFLLIRKKKFDYFLIGVLFACASLTRLNLSLIPLFFLLYFYFFDKKENKLIHTALLNYISAGILVILIVFAPYLLNGTITIALKSIFISGLDMAKNAPNSFFGAIFHLLFTKSDLFKILTLEGMFRIIFWTISFFGFVSLLINLRSDKKYLELILFYVVIFFCIAMGSRASAHYLILLNPFCSIFFSFFCLKILEKNKLFLIPYVFSLFLCSIISINMYANLYGNYKLKNTLYNGASFEIYKYIKDKQIDKDEQIYIYKKNIVYWFLNKYPPTDITHPSDIFKEYLFQGWGKKNSNTKVEFIKILERKPIYILLNSKFADFLSKIYDDDEIINILNSYQYKFERKFEENYLYKKINS